MTEPVTLATPVESLPGITPREARLLRTMSLTNLGRLVAHLPMRHELLAAEATIEHLVPGQIVSARGEVVATRPVRGGRPRFEAVVSDGTGRLDAVWFNQMYRAEQLHPGVRVRLQGKLARRGPQIQMVNPKVEVLSGRATEPTNADARVRPVYPASELVSSALLEKAIASVLQLALPLIEDHLPDVYRRARELPELREAYRMMHAPADLGEAPRGHRRLAYDEFLLLQLGVHMRRNQLRHTLRAPALKVSPSIDAHIRERFPFTLTAGQEAVIAEIATDLSRSVPANRLIQGDVGSGKTVVALYAMLLAVASKHQAALMAPTEILAEQHFASISRMLAGSRVRVELLTGTTAKDAREGILARIASGEADIVIGTHALLTETVKFSSLAVTVIDEQHRFGVHQRATLREKASDATSTPHVVVMTATPIPRTMAITLFGDLDISIITGVPPGRTPVETYAVPGARREHVYEALRNRLEAGDQAYVVVPAIDSTSESTEPPATARTPMRDVRSLVQELEQGAWKGLRLAALHGRLGKDTREAVMQRFRDGTINALIATTVIEVGVDVPNATVMIVEQADRFGLAQLHQLRGRVGRGDKPSVCYLIADPATPDGEQRVAVMTTVNDGFVLAEKDLEIRGPGEIFGHKQSGLPPFKVADLVRDRPLLDMARRDAAEWIARSPRLNTPEETLVRRRLLKAYGAALGLGDVG